MKNLIGNVASAVLLCSVCGTIVVQAQTNDVQEPQASYIVNPTALRQVNEGWGVSLCWWANMCGKWSDSDINKIVNWLVSPDNLNYNIFRYNIGGGDDPEHKNCTLHHMGAGGGKGLRAEMEGFKDSSDGDYIWSRDEAQRKIMLKIKEKRPDAVFEAFSNSAPYYMTYSGCCAGNVNASKDNLKPEYYEEFAHYLVDVCKHYRDEYGIDFKTLEPFNEPQTSYWGANGGQEGCHFDISSQVAFLKVLSPVLKASGLNTVISASDETSVAQSVSAIEQYKSAGVLDLVGQWNTHTYSASDKDRSRVGSLARDAGKMLWMSETGNGGEGIRGNLDMAQRLIDDIKYIMPDAWIDWQYVEEGNDQWCLVKADFADGIYERVKNFYVRQHFSRYIKQGYTYISTLHPQTLAAVSEHSDTLVLVAINPSLEPVSHEASLVFCDSVGDILCRRTTEYESNKTVKDYTLDNYTLRFELPKLSIATFVIPVRVVRTEDTGMAEDAPYMILPQYNTSTCLSADGGTVSIEQIRPDRENPSGISSSQTWFFRPVGDSFVIKNQNGDILTGTLPGYSLTTETAEADGQMFTLAPVEKYLTKIVAEDGVKAFDLEGESSSPGTRVGLWDYGTSVSAGHRNWMLMRLPKDKAVNGISLPVGCDDESFPVRLSCDNDILRIVPEYRLVNVMRMSAALYSLNGEKVLDRPLPVGGLDIPLSKGMYIVCMKVGRNDYCKKVAVK